MTKTPDNRKPGDQWLDHTRKHSLTPEQVKLQQREDYETGAMALFVVIMILGVVLFAVASELIR